MRCARWPRRSPSPRTCGCGRRPRSNACSSWAGEPGRRRGAGGRGRRGGVHGPRPRAAGAARARPHRPRPPAGQARVHQPRLHAPPAQLHARRAAGDVRGHPRARARPAQLPQEDPLARAARGRRRRAPRAAPAGRALRLPPAPSDDDRDPCMRLRLGQRLLAMTLLLAPAVPAPAAAHPTYGVDYLVRVSRRDPGRAHVRWLLAGIDEIRSLRLVFRDDRFADVSGTGTLARDGRTVVWTPGGPYAHLGYTVAIDHRRPPGARFDSHAARDWISTRALYLFPEINVSFREGTREAASRARLVFRLPRGWHSAAALAPLEENVFAVDEPGKRFDRPRGWFLLGRIARHRRRIGGMEVT